MAPKNENRRVSKAELKAAKQRVEFLDIILNSETK